LPWLSFFIYITEKEKIRRFSRIFLLKTAGIIFSRPHKQRAARMDGSDSAGKSAVPAPAFY
jgi:hypothetical protein